MYHQNITKLGPSLKFCQCIFNLKLNTIIGQQCERHIGLSKEDGGRMEKEEKVNGRRKGSEGKEASTEPDLARETIFVCSGFQ